MSTTFTTVEVDGRTYAIKPHGGRSFHYIGEDMYDVFDADAGDRLMNRADPFPDVPTEAQVRALVSPRGQFLQDLLVRFKVVANVDYEYEDLYAQAYSGDPILRYVAHTHDETYHFFTLATTFEDAARDVAGSLGETTGGSPYGVWDLDEQRCNHLSFDVVVREQGGQQRIVPPLPRPIRFTVRSVGAFTYYTFGTQEEADAKLATLEPVNGHPWRVMKEGDEPWFTVVGVWDGDTPIPVGVVQGRHDVVGGDASHFPGGLWAHAVATDDPDEAERLAVEAMQGTLQ